MNPLYLGKKVVESEWSDGIDFVCEYDDDTLREKVAVAWCESMVERMGRVGRIGRHEGAKNDEIGLNYAVDTFDWKMLEAMYKLYKEVRYPFVC